MNSFERSSWSSGIAFVSEAGGLRFKSGVVQIGLSLPTANISSKGAVLHASSMMRRWTPPASYTLWRKTASIIKNLKNCFALQTVVPNQLQFAALLLQWQWNTNKETATSYEPGNISEEHLRLDAGALLILQTSRSWTTNASTWDFLNTYNLWTVCQDLYLAIFFFVVLYVTMNLC